MNKSAPPTAALPCPFCGTAPRLRTRQDEALGAHNIVEWTSVTCPECEIGFDWPPGVSPSAIEQWNRRAPAVQATADADGCAREILSTHYQVWQESIHSGHTVGEADAAQVAHVATIIRKAVSTKAAQEEQT